MQYVLQKWYLSGNFETYEVILYHDFTMEAVHYSSVNSNVTNPTKYTIKEFLETKPYKIASSCLADKELVEMILYLKKTIEINKRR